MKESVYHDEIFSCPNYYLNQFKIILNQELGAPSRLPCKYKIHGEIFLLIIIENFVLNVKIIINLFLNLDTLISIVYIFNWTS